jgi:ferritin-like metal-binding protein YciE
METTVALNQEIVAEARIGTEADLHQVIPEDLLMVEMIPDTDQGDTEAVAEIKAGMMKADSLLHAVTVLQAAMVTEDLPMAEDLPILAEEITPAGPDHQTAEGIQDKTDRHGFQAHAFSFNPLKQKDIMKKKTSSARSNSSQGSRSKTNQTTSSSRANGKQGSSRNSQSRQREDDKREESLLEKFFMDQLKDIYYAENKILKALPKMEEACTTNELKEAFGDHRHQTEKHVKRLEKVFEMMGESPEAEKCEAIDGIISECESIISDTEEGSMTRDAALIMGAQKVEHYEIATYGGLVQFAITMGRKDVSELLDKTLMEEEDTDYLLTDIAESHINIEAEEEKKYSWNKNKNSANTKGKELKASNKNAMA